MDQVYTILVDSREQKPLGFPAHLVVSKPNRGHPTTVQLLTEKVTLETGDYALKGYESATLVERKKGLGELAKNLMTEDSKRFKACLERLRSSCQDPWIVIEGTPASLSEPNRHIPYGPECVLDELHRICRAYRVGFQTVPTDTARQRTAAGCWVARLLINGAILHRDSSTLPAQPDGQ